MDLPQAAPFVICCKIDINTHALLHISLCCLHVAIVVTGVITAKIRSWLFAVAAIDGVWRFVEQKLLLWNKISLGDVNWWRLLHGNLILLSVQLR